MKPLLTRIEEELATCTDPYRRAELLGEQGCYLARVGDFKVAHDIVSALRSDVHIATSGRVAVRIMILEGLLLFFEHLDSSYRDRMLRAHAISHASGYSDLARLSAAWIAHADLSMDKFAEACRMLSYSLASPVRIEDHATIRAYLVLADINMLAGRVDSAKVLYELARRGSVALGDDSSIAATFYNRASMLLNQERVSSVLGCSTHESRRKLELEIRSVNLYHQGSRQTSLAHLLESMNAMILFLSERFSEAVDLYRPLLASGKLLHVGADESIQVLEYSICLLAIGRSDDARAIISALERTRGGQRLFDDSLIIEYLRSRLWVEFGISVGVDGGCVDLPEAISRYNLVVSELKGMLDSMAFQIDLH